MKAEVMKEHPNFELFKQNDIISFFNFQMPRWLVENSKYIGLSLEAKFVYTLLFNRFQLSKHNGWINCDGEVFIIYTRRELAARLSVSEKRVSAAMAELKDYQLIWERRCGRGFANQIYLVNVKISLKDALEEKGGPLDAAPSGEIRTDETTGLESDTDGAKKSNHELTNADSPEDGCFLVEPHNTAVQEPPTRCFKNGQNIGSKAVDSSVHEPPKCPPSYLEFNNKDLSSKNQVMSKLNHDALTDGLSETRELEEIVALAELEYHDSGDAAVICDAIERLYYSRSVKVGQAEYPRERIREKLKRLDPFIIQNTFDKLAGNRQKIRSSAAYTAVVLFNCIIEAQSDLVVDPYLNFLKAARTVKILGGG